MSNNYEFVSYTEMPVRTGSTSCASIGNVDDDFYKLVEQHITPCQENPLELSLNHVVSLEDEIASLKESCNNQGSDSTAKEVMLCGHPGSGKTILLRAVACGVGSKLFVFNLYSLGGAYFKDIVKTIQTVFRVSISGSPSILCLEDLEGINNCEEEFKQTVVAEIENQILKLKEKDHKCFVIASSQRPWDVDERFMKLFTDRRIVKLPGVQDRIQLLGHYLKESCIELSKKDYEEIASLTEGFTPADIVCLCKDACNGPIRDIMNAQYFKKVKISVQNYRKETVVTGQNSAGEQTQGISADGSSQDSDWVEKWTPCEPHDEHSVKMCISDFEDSEDILALNVTKQHLFQALHRSRPSISKEETIKMCDFVKSSCST